MSKKIEHLQTEKPTMEWGEWFSEVVQLYADAENIELLAALRRINVHELEKWYKDGFTPYAAFRETYEQ